MTETATSGMKVPTDHLYAPNAWLYGQNQVKFTLEPGRHARVSALRHWFQTL